jgi:methylenetetrahydrofolate dehydrogenase (NADP+)/methenyltetrahydrofolate cyclohydrolase
MAATLLDGKSIVERLNAETVAGVERYKGEGVTLKLVAVLVGSNPGAVAYAKMQKKACDGVGIEYELRELPEATTQDELAATIQALNDDPRVTGIILQTPVPMTINQKAMQALISPKKDVDGVSPANMGAIVLSRARLAPCTALSVMSLIRESGVTLKGLEVVMVGHSEIVGKPVALFLLDELATVTVCHIGTRDTAAHTRNADLVIVATGVPGLIKADMVKDGVVVIDVGINRVEGKIVGDVDFEPVAAKASQITPVPGGVGPCTVAHLLNNVVKAADWQRE